MYTVKQLETLSPVVTWKIETVSKELLDLAVVFPSRMFKAPVG